MRYLLMTLVLTGCSMPDVVYVEKPDPHLQCMVMCESARNKVPGREIDEIRFRVEKYCYKQCNEKSWGSRPTSSSRPPKRPTPFTFSVHRI